jgi:Fic family protein
MGPLIYSAMDTRQFKTPAGRLVKTLGGVDAFEPSDLPGKFGWEDSVVSAVQRASMALGRLQGLGSKLREPQRLVRMFLRSEAEASSRIEQTYARVRTMLLFEHSPEVAESSESVQEVENNFRVLEAAFDVVRQRPLTVSDVRALHSLLFQNVSRPPKVVGEFRHEQNWIGNSKRIEEARYVPPPPLSVPPLMAQLVKYLSEGDQLPQLVRAAMAHYQFEAIHPFEDGNGRIGRAIVLAQLHREKVLDEPLLNPSAGLERNRREYYDCLLEVSRRGAWGPWIELFCRSIADEADASIVKLDRLEEIRDAYHAKLRRAGCGAKLAALVDHLMGEPARSAKQAAALFGVTQARGQQMLQKLESLGITREITGKARHRVWLAHEFLEVFSSSKGPTAKRPRRRSRT